MEQVVIALPGAAVDDCRPADCHPKHHLREDRWVDVSPGRVSQVCEPRDEGIDGVDLCLGAHPGEPARFSPLGARPSEIRVAQVIAMSESSAIELRFAGLPIPSIRRDTMFVVMVWLAWLARKTSLKMTAKMSSRKLSGIRSPRFAAAAATGNPP